MLRVWTYSPQDRNRNILERAIDKQCSVWETCCRSRSYSGGWFISAYTDVAFVSKWCKHHNWRLRRWHGDTRHWWQPKNGNVKGPENPTCEVCAFFYFARWLWDEWCKMSSVCVSAVRWVAWDEWYEMSGERWVVWDAWCGMSAVRWAVWDEWLWDERCVMSGVEWMVWDDRWKMTGERVDASHDARFAPSFCHHHFHHHRP